MNHSLSLTRPNLRWLAAGLAVGMLAVALAGPGAGVAQAQSDSDETLRTINVNGTGRVKAEPDVADINLGVTKQGEDALAASAKAAEAMDSMINALLALGIDEKDIQTTSLNLNPIYDYEDRPPNIVGWQASNMVSVVVRDIDSVGEVADAATKAGATDVNGISFRVEDPTAAQAVARAAAVEDAEAKAQQLAMASGTNIIGVVTITESGGQTPQPIYMARSEAAFDAAVSTPVLPGEVELSVNVQIQYEIE